MTNQRKYGQFGKGSSIICPDRIIGHNNIYIGDNVTILNHARIEALTHYKQQTFTPSIQIGSNCGIGRMVHIEACDRVEIGNDVLMSENVFISDCSHDYHSININIANQILKSKSVSIGDFCFIGRNACILPGAQLGKQCVVGANAVVCAGEYPDYSVLGGVPARVIKSITSTSSAH